MLVAAHPSLPAHRGAGLLPLPQPRPGAADPAGRGRRTALDGRGVLPGRQGPGRPGRTPGAPLAALAALDPAGDARPRPARRSGRRRTRRGSSTGRTDPAHLQRAAAAAHPPGPRPGTPPRRSGGLVPMAATTPIPLPCQPLPPPSRRPFMIKRSTAGVLTQLQRYWRTAFGRPALTR